MYSDHEIYDHYTRELYNYTTNTTDRVASTVFRVLYRDLHADPSSRVESGANVVTPYDDSDPGERSQLSFQYKQH